MISDLHIHSSFSDGSFKPLEIAKMAFEKNIAAISITDHDTVTGLKEAETAAKGYNLFYIKGIELSAYDIFEIHFLGYNFNQDHPLFKETLDELKNYREYRNKKTLENLKNMCGIELLESDIIKTDGECWGSMHIARALVKKGLAKSVQGAFNKYVGRHCPAYVRESRITPKQAIGMIVQSGGKAVLAHPSKIPFNKEFFEKKLAEFADLGLSGIETYYPSHTLSEINYFHLLAKKYNLFETAGSDFHGEPSRGEVLGRPHIDLDLKKILT